MSDHTQLNLHDNTIVFMDARNKQNNSALYADIGTLLFAECWACPGIPEQTQQILQFN